MTFYFFYFYANSVKFQRIYTIIIHCEKTFASHKITNYKSLTTEKRNFFSAAIHTLSSLVFFFLLSQEIALLKVFILRTFKHAKHKKAIKINKLNNI